MANYPKWFASMTLRDNADRTSIWQIRVPEATAKLYFAAADKAARDATAIGLLFAQVLLCTDMVLESQGVTVLDETAPLTLPASGVARGNKIVLLGEAGPDPWKLTIPGRKASAFTLKTNSVEIDIDEAGALNSLIALIMTTGIGTNNGLAINVLEGMIND